MPDHLHHLLQRREAVAEASITALAHGHPDAEALGEILGDIEAAIEHADSRLFDTQLGDWLQADQERIPAHLTNTADNCTHCLAARNTARAS